jgi:hypothetical protein
VQKIPSKQLRLRLAAPAVMAKVRKLDQMQ